MTAATDLAHRARFISVEDGFDIRRPALEPCSFDAELRRARDRAAATGRIDLDRSPRLGTPWPATSPLMLAGYARIRRGERLAGAAAATAEIHCVVQGRGRTSRPDVCFDWGPGDVFCLPGGVETAHEALDGDCVLFSVTDAPMLAFAGLRPPPAAESPIEPVHYTADVIAAQLEALYARTLAPDTPGRALFLTSTRMAANRTCTPSLTLTLNAVLPGEAQPPHRHNAAAIVLITRAGSCRSRIGDAEFPWDHAAALLTPPNAVHSHRNDGDEIAVALIIQDGGLHYHCRTMGFAFA